MSKNIKNGGNKMSDINVFTGPMKSGKSQKIINEAHRQMIAGKKIQMFKPKLDTRDSQCVADRNGNKLTAINITDIEEIQGYDADVYIIDEFQFLNGDVNTIQELASKGKRFFIAGLNLTAEKKPFGKMGDLLCVSDNVQMLTSICEVCKNDNAIYSYCKEKKDSDILVGDSQYIPVCRNCYDKLVNESIIFN